MSLKCDGMRVRGGGDNAGSSDWGVCYCYLLVLQGLLVPCILSRTGGAMEVPLKDVDDTISERVHSLSSSLHGQLG